MLSAFTAEERDAIIEGVLFHTLEADDDGFLALDGENRERIAAAIAERDANIFACDPLRDFGTEDLNGDKNMTDTLREIARLTRRGNPRRVPLIIHHAGTGRAGIQKATGFGRNSKVFRMGMRTNQRCSRPARR